MMMPANFSVVAENEMTYVVGGGLLEAIGSVTAPVWTSANVKTFKLVSTTLGVMFGGNWGGDGAGSSIFSADKGGLGSIVKYGISGKTTELNSFNKFMQVVGLGAAVYQLGTADAKTYVKETKVLKA